MGSPDTIDPYSAANSQAGLNKSAAVQSQELSDVNQISPYGSLTYSQTGTNPDGTPITTATSALTPQAQAVFNQTLGNQGTAATQAGQLLQNSNLGQGVDLGQSATEARLDALNRTTLDPQWQQQSDQLQQSLYNRGIMPGSQAYDTATRDEGQQRNDAYNQAYLSDYQGVNNEALAQQAGNLNTYNALQTGAQVANPTTGDVSTPQTTVQSPNLTNMVSSYNQAQTTANNAMMGGLFGLGDAALNGGTGGVSSSLVGKGLSGLSALALASDRRLKTDISPVGSLANGLPVYLFRYKSGGPMQIGLMADDVEKVCPEAVHEIDGFKAVNYAMAAEA